MIRQSLNFQHMYFPWNSQFRLAPTHWYFFRFDVWLVRCLDVQNSVNSQECFQGGEVHIIRQGHLTCELLLQLAAVLGLPLHFCLNGDYVFFQGDTDFLRFEAVDIYVDTVQVTTLHDALDGDRSRKKSTERKVLDKIPLQPLKCTVQISKHGSEIRTAMRAPQAAHCRPITRILLMKYKSPQRHHWD